MLFKFLGFLTRNISPFVIYLFGTHQSIFPISSKAFRVFLGWNHFKMLLIVYVFSRFARQYILQPSHHW